MSPKRPSTTCLHPNFGASAHGGQAGSRGLSLQLPLLGPLQSAGLSGQLAELVAGATFACRAVNAPFAFRASFSQPAPVLACQVRSATQTVSRSVSGSERPCPQVFTALSSAFSSALRGRSATSVHSIQRPAKRNCVAVVGVTVGACGACPAESRFSASVT